MTSLNLHALRVLRGDPPFPASKLRSLPFRGLPDVAAMAQSLQ